MNWDEFACDGQKCSCHDPFLCSTCGCQHNEAAAPVAEGLLPPGRRIGVPPADWQRREPNHYDWFMPANPTAEVDEYLDDFEAKMREALGDFYVHDMAQSVLPLIAAYRAAKALPAQAGSGGLDVPTGVLVRALYTSGLTDDMNPVERRKAALRLRDAIRERAAYAAQAGSGGLDVERLARALHDNEDHQADTPAGPTCWRCMDKATAIAATYNELCHNEDCTLPFTHLGRCAYAAQGEGA